MTEAHHDRGVAELVEAIEAHRAHRASHADGQGGEAHREREFLDVLDGELRARLEKRIDGAAATVLARVRRGEVDPYTATHELLRDRDALRRLLGES
jgi:putative protein kinase ArgK-like GTPase of G3E family